jgi:hypothetical protein
MTRAQIAGLLVLFLCAVGLDLLGADRLKYSDERDYSNLAHSLLHQGTFAYPKKIGQPIESRPPGYPFVLTAIYAVVERPLAAKLVNAVFLVLATLLLGHLAAQWHPRAPSLVPWLVLAYPLLLYAAGTLYPQTLACLLLSAVILLITGPDKSVRFLCAGLIYGALILAVPYFLALLPVFAAYLLVLGPGSRARRLSSAAVLIVASAAVVAPWTVRNYLVFHTLVPVSANNGYNLFVGNSPQTTPNSGLNVPVLQMCNHLRRHMSESDFDAAFKQCALEWITANPGAAAWLYVGKLVNYFNYRNEIATASASDSAEGGWRDWLVFFTYYPLLALVLVRAACARRLPLARAETLILLLYFLNAAASAVFFTRLRFRIPFDFMLIAVEAAFLCRVWQAWVNRPYRPGLQSQQS